MYETLEDIKLENELLNVPSSKHFRMNISASYIDIHSLGCARWPAKDRYLKDFYRKN